MLIESRGTTLVPRYFPPFSGTRLKKVGSRPKRWSGTLGGDNGAHRPGLFPRLTPSGKMRERRLSTKKLEGEFAGTLTLRLPAHGLILYRSIARGPLLLPVAAFPSYSIAHQRSTHIYRSSRNSPFDGCIPPFLIAPVGKSYRNLRNAGRMNGARFGRPVRVLVQSRRATQDVAKFPNGCEVTNAQKNAGRTIPRRPAEPRFRRVAQ